MEKVCKECGKPARERFHGEWFCKRHYLQMYRHGHCLARTIYDGNNYEDIYIGTYPTFIEAALARLQSEKDLFGEYGGQKDLYYILDSPNPSIELQRVLTQKGIAC